MKKKLLKRTVSILLCTMMLASIFALGTVNTFAETENSESVEESTDGILTYNNFLYILSKYSSEEEITAEIVGFEKAISGRVEIPDTIDGYKVSKFNLVYEASNKALIKTNLEYATGITEIKISKYMVYFDCLREENKNGLQGFASLRNIEVDPENEKFFTEDGVLFSKGTHCLGVEIINDAKMLEVYPTAKEGSDYVIKDNVDVVSYEAFYGCKNLKSVTIPDSVKYIGQGAFWYCENLENITFGQNITTIESYAFEKTAYYNNPENWNENGLLYDSNKKYLIGVKDTINGSIKIDDNVSTIIAWAFRGNENITEIKLPSKIKNIPSKMCEGCTNLLTCDLPNSVETIGSSAFLGCKNLRDVKIGENVKSIETGAFGNCISISAFNVDKNNSKYFSDNNGVLFENNDVIVKLVAYPCASTNESYTIPAFVACIDETAFINSSNLKEILVEEGNKSLYSDNGVALYWQNKVLYHIISTNNYKVLDGTTMINIPASMGSNIDNPTVIHIPKTAYSISYVAYDGNYLAPDYILYEGTEEDWEKVIISPYYANVNTKVIFNAYGKTFVDFDVNGGSVTVEPQAVEKDTTITLPTATKDGYNFLGWSTAKDNASTKVDGNYKVTKDITLYALWEKEDSTEEPTAEFKITNGDIALNRGGTTQIKTNTSSKVKYESSNPSVATVDENGNVTARLKGTATITATVLDSNGVPTKATDTVNVTVNYTLIHWIAYILLLGFLWF